MTIPEPERIKGFITRLDKNQHPYLKDSFWLDSKNHFWKDEFHNSKAYLEFETVKLAEGKLIPRYKK